MTLRKRSSNTSINWKHFASLAIEWEDSVIDNIDEEYNRLVITGRTVKTLNLARFCLLLATVLSFPNLRLPLIRTDLRERFSIMP
nr:unnamed protein product [Haemonchus contortus]